MGKYTHPRPLDIPHPTKRPKRFTAKQKKFAEVLIRTNNASEAARQAYPDSKNPGSIGSTVKKAILPTLIEVLDKAGATDEKIAQTIFEALDATKLYYSKAAGDWKDHADYDARIKAAELASKLKNKFPKKEMEVEHNFNVIVARGNDVYLPVRGDNLESGYSSVRGEDIIIEQTKDEIDQIP